MSEKLIICPHCQTPREQDDVCCDGVACELMSEAMQEFVDRCDAGEVRSKYTYAKFNDILERAG